MTRNTGPFDVKVLSDGVAALFTRIGPGILVTHSQSGGPGWLSAIKSQSVRAVVAVDRAWQQLRLPRVRSPAHAERLRYP